MSRHRDVRNLDYDELLDDEAGGDDMSPAEMERLDQAVDAITARLGDGFSIKELKDAAWYYYFDIDQSTNYLLEQRAKREEKRLKAMTTLKTGMSIVQPHEDIVSAPSASHVPPGYMEIEPVTETPSTGLSTLKSPVVESVNPTNAKPKKLSKLQQLIKDKAASKNAASLTKISNGVSPSLASSLAKLTIEKAGPPMPTESNQIPSIVDEPPSTGLQPEPQIEESGEHERDQAARAGLKRKLDTAQLARPSAFATTILAGSEKKLSKVQNSFTQPSPDDIVQHAQSRSKGMIKGKIENSTKVSQSNEPEADKMSVVKAANQPRRGRPNRSTLKYISLVVVGHVDAGKSTLFGRLLYDLGEIDERSMQRLKRESEKLQKSSFAFAWAMDSGIEERERGVTIDIATNTFEAGSTAFTILDAPGHKDFVPNMIAGASQADFAIMVIDASTGAFESGFDAAGQTKEHAILVRSLGIQRVIIAVNKLDNVHWSESRFKDIQVQLTTFLKHTGFEEAALSFIPCSGLSGQNVTNTMSREICDWYSGRSLLEEMHTVEALSRDETAPFRMIISDIQATPNSNNVTVTGRISSGELQRDDTVLCMPSKEPATVKALISGETIDSAFAGDNTTLTLANIDPIHLRVGDVLCHPANPVQISTSFKARMVTFPMLRPLLTGSSIVLHRGRADLPAIIKKIEVPNKARAGEFKTARHVTGANQAIMTLELVRGVIPLETFSSNKDLGRVIVRREGDTVCAGVVLELL